MQRYLLLITCLLIASTSFGQHYDFSAADFELLSAELKINGKVVPYTLDMVHKKLFFNMLELSGAGNYTLTITARTTANLGPKTETATLRWANNPAGITETATFNVVD